MEKLTRTMCFAGSALMAETRAKEDRSSIAAAQPYIILRISGFIFLRFEFIIYGKLPFEYTYGFLERIND